MKAWIGFIWLRMKLSGGACVNTVMNIGLARNRARDVPILKRIQFVNKFVSKFVKCFYLS